MDPNEKVLEMPEPRQFLITLADDTILEVLGHEAQISVCGALTITRGVQVSPTQAVNIVAFCRPHASWKAMSEVPPVPFSALSIH